MAQPTKPNNVLSLAIFALLWTGALTVITIFDMGSAFMYFPRWLFYLCACALLIPLIRGQYWRPKLMLTVALLIWFMVLPSIRWNHLKGFYNDCASIRVGMSVEQARTIMQPYIDASERNGFFTAYMAGIEEPAGGHATRLLFIPTEQEAADWCVVYPVADRVTARVMSPD